MNKLLDENMKLDIGFEPQEIATTLDVSSRFFDLSTYRKALFLVSLLSSGIEFGENVVITVDEAEDTDGTNAQHLVEDVWIEGAIRATVASIDIGAVPVAGDIVNVNGVDFTCDVVGYDPILNPFGWSDAGELADAITGSELGLTAAEALNVVEIISTVPGERTITIEITVDALSTVALPLTLQAIGYAEVEASELSEGYTAVNANVLNSAANDIVASMVLVRGNVRYTPEQKVAVEYPE